MKRVIGEEVLLTSQVCMVSDETYITEGESVIITKELELIIELLEKSEKTLSSASYDLKNIIEIIKLETT